MESGKVFFVTEAPETDGGLPPDFNVDELGDEVRTVHYNFPPEFLNLKTVGTRYSNFHFLVYSLVISLVFSVGSKEVPNFRIIERHYFANKLVKSFDFKFGFCIPNTKNSWEVIYDMPNFSEKEKKKIINSDGEMVSDSFYFVNDKLVMHNKAYYTYKKD